jgi:hypothetical protein
VTLYSEYYDITHKKRFQKLGIIANGNIFDLYINNYLIKRIEDNELETGDTGLIATSTGEFVFDNFTVYHNINSR